MPILANHDVQRKPTFIRVDENLTLLLENLIYLIERMWRDEVKANRSEVDTPRQAVLRKSHQALGEWLKLETLSREECR